MNLNQLRYFDLLSSTLHYQKAAEILGISQPALSRSITALESELGAPLFDRSRRIVTLSEYGIAFARHIHGAMIEIDLGTTTVREMADPNARVIQLSSTYGLSTVLLPMLARDFLQQNKDAPISFQFRQDSSPGIIDNLRKGMSELGFCSFLPDEPDINYEPVYRWDVCLVVPKNHSFAGRESVSLQEVAGQPMILSLDKTYYVDNLFRSRGLAPHVVLRLEEDHAAAAMVANGFGLSILPYNESLRFYGVELIPFSDSDTFRTYYLAHLRTHTLSTAAKAFRQFVLSHDLAQYAQDAVPQKSPMASKSLPFVPKEL